MEEQHVKVFNDLKRRIDEDDEPTRQALARLDDSVRQMVEDLLEVSQRLERLMDSKSN